MTEVSTVAFLNARSYSLTGDSPKWQLCDSTVRIRGVGVMLSVGLALHSETFVGSMMIVDRTSVSIALHDTEVSRNSGLSLGHVGSGIILLIESTATLFMTPSHSLRVTRSSMNVSAPASRIRARFGIVVVWNASNWDMLVELLDDSKFSIGNTYEEGHFIPEYFSGWVCSQCLFVPIDCHECIDHRQSLVLGSYARSSSIRRGVLVECPRGTHAFQYSAGECNVSH